MELKYKKLDEYGMSKAANALAAIIQTDNADMIADMAEQWLRFMVQTSSYQGFVIMRPDGSIVAVVCVREREHWFDVEARWIEKLTSDERDVVRLEFEKSYRANINPSGKPMWWWIH